MVLSRGGSGGRRRCTICPASADLLSSSVDVISHDTWVADDKNNIEPRFFACRYSNRSGATFQREARARFRFPFGGDETRLATARGACYAGWLTRSSSEEARFAR